MGTYAQDLRIFRNKKMHGRDMNCNDAVRIYVIRRRWVFEALGAGAAGGCESQLNRVHADLLGAGEAAPVCRAG